MDSVDSVAQAPNPEKPLTLVGKLAAIMGAVERVAKRGRNDFHGYNYATEADIVDHVRKGMAEHGVIMIPNVLHVEWRDVTGAKGQVIPMCVLTVEFTVTDGSADAIKFVMLGSGMDSGDKGPYKALTGATKYAMLKLLLIPTGDDPEKEEAAKKEKQASGSKPITGLVAEDVSEIMAAAKKRWGGGGYTSKRITAHLDAIARGLGAESLASLTPDLKPHMLDAIANGSDPE